MLLIVYDIVFIFRKLLWVLIWEKNGVELNE